MKYHFIAFLTVSVWGTTFVWTKLLIINGLSPAQIFTLRFVIAYVLMLGFSLVHFAARKRRGETSRKRFRWFADSIADELTMVALGITGGSLYFYTENEALNYTTATNTSLIVCSCPLFAMLLIALAYRSERIRRSQAVGSLIAFAGMAIVVLNGRFVLNLSPVGDALAFAACLCWAAYSLLMKPAAERYSSLFITRKVFFYGVVTILPYYILVPGFPTMETLMRPQVLTNVLFLGCVASMVCFLTWNWCIAKLGAVKATNWVYINPITTIVAAWLVLSESITIYFLVGSSLILLGMYLAERQTEKTKK